MARRSRNQDEREVRLSVQLFASDNPLLVADLLNVRKGKLRHTRLVTLATIGLMTECRVIAGDLSPVVAVQHATFSRADDSQRRLLTGDELAFIESN